MAELLSAQDGADMARLLIAVQVVRDSLLADAGLDLNDPFTFLMIDRSCLLKLSELVQTLRRERNYLGANATAVWLFTLRGADDPQLRMSARRIWAQLARGIKAADGHLSNRIPKGFNPTPE